MKAVVFANADINDYGFCEKYIKDAVIICCDGGMRHTMKLGITPDYIVGDFDSVSDEVLEYYRKQDIELKQVPCKKDETDMELGIRHAVGDYGTLQGHHRLACGQSLLHFGGYVKVFVHLISPI